VPLLIKLLIAGFAAYLVFRIGFGVLRGFAVPLPEPPPAGELRKMKRIYRCSSCGMEIRMQVAASDDPDPPRHCMDEMDLIKTEEDFL
jgi:hypothetical protein